MVASSQLILGSRQLQQAVRSREPRQFSQRILVKHPGAVTANAQFAPYLLEGHGPEDVILFLLTFAIHVIDPIAV